MLHLLGFLEDLSKYKDCINDISMFLRRGLKKPNDKGGDRKEMHH